MNLSVLCSEIQSRFNSWIMNAMIAYDELTIDVVPAHLLALGERLRDDTDFNFNLLLDVCGVDYLHYGLSEWETQTATATGFSRGVEKTSLTPVSRKSNRFAVVYHLLSLTHGHRVRLRVNLPDENELIVDSVMSIWPSA